MGEGGSRSLTGEGFVSTDIELSFAYTPTYSGPAKRCASGADPLIPSKMILRGRSVLVSRAAGWPRCRSIAYGWWREKHCQSIVGPARERQRHLLIVQQSHGRMIERTFAAFTCQNPLCLPAALEVRASNSQLVYEPANIRIVGVACHRGAELCDDTMRTGRPVKDESSGLRPEEDVAQQVFSPSASSHPANSRDAFAFQRRAPHVRSSM